MLWTFTSSFVLCPMITIHICFILGISNIEEFRFIQPVIKYVSSKQLYCMFELINRYDLVRYCIAYNKNIVLGNGKITHSPCMQQWATLFYTLDVAIVLHLAVKLLIKLTKYHWTKLPYQRIMLSIRVSAKSCILVIIENLFTHSSYYWKFSIS